MTAKLSVPYLESQCKDGWWPYVPGGGESVEATTWCAIACRKNTKLAAAAIKHLSSTQNADGGWSTASGTGKSDWATGAALLTINLLERELAAAGEKPVPAAADARQRGFAYLSSLRADLITDLTRTAMMVVQGPDFDYPRGWPWEPDTYHWIEPTSYAVLAIRSSPYAGDKRYQRMCAQAYQYFFEKTCTPAGWNFGSPRTLGADWPPEPWPTALALIALQQADFAGATDKEKYLTKRQDALNYLRKDDGPSMQTTIARSLSLIARDVYGDDVTKDVDSLQQGFTGRQSLAENLCAIAAATIACNLGSQGNPFKLV